MGCVYLHFCIIAPQREELPEELKNLIVRLHKEGTGYRAISD